MKARTYIAIAIITVGVGLVGYYLYLHRREKGKVLDLRGDGLGGVRVAQRDFRWLGFGPTNGISNGFLFPYIQVNLPKYIPILNGSAIEYNEARRLVNRQIMQNILQHYDKLLAPLCSQYKVPKALAYAVLAVESGVYHRNLPPRKPIISPAGALGPAQIKPITATDTVRIAMRKGIITPDAANAYISKRISPTKAQQVTKTTQLGDVIIGRNTAELQDDALSLFIMVLKLSNLIDNYDGFRPDRFHLVLYCYNQGDYRLSSSKSPDYNLDKQAITATQFYNKAKSAEGRNYLLKALGQHGALDIAINDLNITDLIQ